MRHGAFLYERSPFSGPDRRAKRDARRTRHDPGAGADPDRRAHRLDGAAQCPAGVRPLPPLRIAAVVLVAGAHRTAALAPFAPALAVDIAPGTYHDRPARDPH